LLTSSSLLVILDSERFEGHIDFTMMFFFWKHIFRVVDFLRYLHMIPTNIFVGVIGPRWYFGWIFFWNCDYFESFMICKRKLGKIQKCSKYLWNFHTSKGWVKLTHKRLNELNLKTFGQFLRTLKFWNFSILAVIFS